MFTIGSDPEVFVGLNNKFHSAHALVKGTKNRPFPVHEGAVQVDGMALEYNISPCETRAEFVHRINYVKQQMEDMIGEYSILPVSTVEFKPEDVINVPPRNFNLGCSVDFNAYTGKPNESPDGDMMMRTAGGHVHIGYFPTKRKFDKDHMAKCTRLARLMDKELGVYSLLWDKDTKRRSMYGKAGCFRPTLFGVEYRSLSNLWVFNDDLIRFVYDATKEAYSKFLNGEDVVSDKYSNIINNSLFDSDILKDKKAQRVKEILAA